MADELQVQVRFTVETPQGNYTDALYYPLSAWPVKQVDIDAAKQARSDAWVAIVTAPPVDQPAPTTYEVVAKQADIDQQIADLAQQKADLSAALSDAMQPADAAQAVKLGQ